VEPHVDENTIGVAAVLGTTFTGHADDIVGINDLLVRLRDERGLDVPLHVDGASGGFVWPFLYPDSEWDFRLEQVRSINVVGPQVRARLPGHRLADLPRAQRPAEDLVFYENYLGKTDATFTLNFSTGSAMVLAQYYNFVRFGRAGYRYIMETMQATAALLAQRIADIGEFRLIGGESDEQLPLVAFQLDRRPELRRVRRRVAARRRARLDGSGLHAAAQRRPRDDHARAGQADARPVARGHARRRHRAGVRDAQAEGRAARARPQAGEDLAGVLRPSAGRHRGAVDVALGVAEREGDASAHLASARRTRRT
jgi:glutamate/tyrosine decarboxylase-like PLP-dependent enzyme